MDDRIVNKDGDAFLKLRCIYQDTVYEEANLVAENFCIQMKGMVQISLPVTVMF